MKLLLLPLVLCLERGPRPNVSSTVSSKLTEVVTEEALTELDIANALMNLFQSPYEGEQQTVDGDSIRVLSNIIQIDLDETARPTHNHEYSVNITDSQTCPLIVKFSRVTTIFYLTIASLVLSILTFVIGLLLLDKKPHESLYIKAQPLCSSSSLTHSE